MRTGSHSKAYFLRNKAKFAITGKLWFDKDYKRAKVTGPLSTNTTFTPDRLRTIYTAVERAAHLHISIGTPLTRAFLTPLLDRLPVFPVCAAEVLRVARGGQMTAAQLVSLANRDQVLAGHLVHAANAAKYTWSGQVRNVEQAVAYLGEIRATQMLVEAAVKPIMTVVGHRTLWEHSQEAAAVAHRLALSSGLVPPSDAYLLGLVHDVGTLLLALAPAEARAALQSLIAGGCETPVAELLIFGTTHAHAGADVLRHWGMPEDYVAAVEYHHDPEVGGGAGAAILYLTEQWTEPDGDRLRDDRLEFSMSELNLSEVLPYKWEHALRH